MKPEIELLEPCFLQLWKKLDIKHVIGGKDAFTYMVNSYSNLAFCKTETSEEYHEFVYYSMLLDLYQLLGKKAEREHPLDFENADFIPLKGTDFGRGAGIDGYIEYTKYYKPVPCVLAGVWFSREKDRLEALKICGITKEFQEKCAKGATLVP